MCCEKVEELSDVAQEIVDEVGMNMLERKRFLKACGVGAKLGQKAATQLPVKSMFDDDTDPT